MSDYSRGFAEGVERAAERVKRAGPALYLKWNEVTGAIAEQCSWDWEIRSIFTEDLPKCILALRPSALAPGGGEPKVPEVPRGPHSKTRTVSGAGAPQGVEPAGDGPPAPTGTDPAPGGARGEEPHNEPSQVAGGEGPCPSEGRRSEPSAKDEPPAHPNPPPVGAGEGAVALLREARVILEKGHRMNYMAQLFRCIGCTGLDGWTYGNREPEGEEHRDGCPLVALRVRIGAFLARAGQEGK